MLGALAAWLAVTLLEGTILIAQEKVALSHAFVAAAFRYGVHYAPGVEPVPRDSLTLPRPISPDDAGPAPPRGLDTGAVE